MRTKQTVAVIGASEKPGYAIAKCICEGSYRLLLQSADENKLQQLIGEIEDNHPSADVQAIRYPLEACFEADIVITALPDTEEEHIAGGGKGVSQRILISVANLFNDTSSQPATYQTITPEEWQTLLSGEGMNQTHNVRLTGDFRQPACDSQRVDAFFADTEDDALQTVYELIRFAGFRPAIVGSLTVAEQWKLCSFYSSNWRFASLPYARTAA